MNQSLEQAIDAVGLFSNLNVSARACLARYAVLRHFHQGETLWLAGDRPHGLYIILEGGVRIMRGTGGRQHVVHTEGPGGTIGGVPLYDGGAYPATAVAACVTRCLFVPVDALRAAMRADPDLAWGLLRGLGARIRGLVDQLNRTTLWTVRSRLAAYLLGLARDDGDCQSVTLTMPQSALAEELGTVREVLARELATLRRHGVLSGAGGRRLEVLQPAALRRLAAGDDTLTRQPH